jgi:tetratricopeptide (TPR) repeat protein
VAGVFLSYRRVERAWADRLARNLANRFGADLVFQDVEDIAGGQRWRDSIHGAIEAAEVVAAAIGPHWLVDDSGRRRLDEPGDVLRAELVEALELEKPMVPVLLGGAAMPAGHEVPEVLSDLTERQAIRLDDLTWNIDVERLLERVRALILPTRGSEPLPLIKEELGRLQGDFFTRLEGDDVAGALDVAQRTLATLDRISPLYPEDVYLQAVRGYTHKNCAIALLSFGRDADASARLDAADRVFTTLLDEYPDDPSASDGKGSVLATRGELKESLPYFERAIELKPDFVEARQNRDAVVQALEEISR